jgi:FAD/FMN-containing dehydrogenase
MSKYGLALDNLRSADLVMADGRVVRASVDENPDLFWAIRGGGGNFGIAVSLEYLLHPVGPMITGGVVAHPVQRAADVLRFFRDTCSSLPDEATLFAALQTAPDGFTKVAGLVGSHCGPIAQGEAAFRRVKAFGATRDGCDGADPVHDAERHARSGVPEGRAQLLESAVSDRPQRRAPFAR